MRVGMIGTGGIASDHLKGLAQVPGVEIIAVAGRDKAKADSKAAAHGAVAYGDWKPMVDRETLDAVYVCLPPKLSAEVAAACAGKVRGILVEKPVASQVADAERTARAFQTAGTIAAAGYHNRVRQVTKRIKELCAEQPPVMAEAYWHGDMPPPAWWRTRSISGGQMTEQCTHLIDLLRVWLGEATEVSAAAARGTMSKEIAGFDVDDALTATIRFGSGAVAAVHVSCIAKPGQGIAGVGMTLRARGWEARLSDWGLDAQIRHAGGREETIAAETDVFRRQAEAFTAAVTANDASQLPCTYADAVNTLRLTRAIDEAAESGQVTPVRKG